MIYYLLTYSITFTYSLTHLLTYSLTHYFYALLTGAPGLRAKLRRRLPGAMRARGRLPAGAALLPVHPRQGLGSAPDSEQHLLRPRSVPSQLATPKMARDVYCLGSYLPPLRRLWPATRPEFPPPSNRVLIGNLSLTGGSIFSSRDGKWPTQTKAWRQAAAQNEGRAAGAG